jgi:riboflavin synthase
MFTGIVAEVGQVIFISSEKLTVGASQILDGIELGGSVAVNGTCLTVTSFNTNSFTVGLSAETLNRTSLEKLKTGSPVNLERPLGLGGELGGHLVQGHIDNTGNIVSMVPDSGSTIIRIEAPEDIMRYVVEKGFIAIEGISLTITAVGAGYFQVSVVDYTRAHTNLADHMIGDPVNLEVDIMAKYAERFMQTRQSNITMEYLKENGF